jgi:hypothetical protein
MARASPEVMNGKFEARTSNRQRQRQNKPIALRFLRDGPRRLQVTSKVLEDSLSRYAFLNIPLCQLQLISVFRRRQDIASSASKRS